MTSRVYLIEDHPLLQHAMIEFINRSAELSICGSAVGQEAIAQILAVLPDLVITDIRLVGTDGIRIVRALRKLLPTLSILVYSSYYTSDYVNSALRAGAIGYVVKGQPLDLLEAIQHVLAGEIYLCPRARRCLDFQ